MSVQSDAAKKWIGTLLNAAYPVPLADGLTWQAEYPFDKIAHGKKGRAWRFDYAVPSLKVAIELQGGIWNQPNAHLNDKYLEKMNAAAKAGWRVFYYTPAMVIKAGRKVLEVACVYHQSYLSHNSHGNFNMRNPA